MNHKLKPPQARVSDVLFMDKDYLRGVVQFVRDGLHLLPWHTLPKLVGYWNDLVKLGKVSPDAPVAPKLHLYGSYPFGNARLRSDMDFGLAFPDWNCQKAAREFFYIPKWREAFGQYIDRYSLDTGLEVQVGCVDAESDKYNIHLDCDTWLLHFRFEPDLDFYQAGSINEVIDRVETHPPVNIMEYDEQRDGQVPVHNIHLKLDNYAFRWLPNENPFKALNSSWDHDDYADQVDYWRQRYGSRFLEYRHEGDRLIPL